MTYNRIRPTVEEHMVAFLHAIDHCNLHGYSRRCQCPICKKISDTNKRRRLRAEKKA